MALFRRAKAAPSDLATLHAWVHEHQGVEAYVEPQTSVTPTTVVLVAGDGEFIRRRVPTPQAAADFARKAGIPVYDTNRVGLPQRMRDFAVRQSRDAAPPAVTLNPHEQDAVLTLAGAAAMPVPGAGASRDELRSLLRVARSRVHPDRVGGDRSAWDAVEAAAQVLGLR